MPVISWLFIPRHMTHKIPRWQWQCWSTVLSSAYELGRAQQGQQLIACASPGSVKTSWLRPPRYKQLFFFLFFLHRLKLLISPRLSAHSLSVKQAQRDSDTGQQRVNNVMKIDMHGRAHFVVKDLDVPEECWLLLNCTIHTERGD